MPQDNNSSDVKAPLVSSLGRISITSSNNRLQERSANRINMDGPESNGREVNSPAEKVKLLLQSTGAHDDALDNSVAEQINPPLFIEMLQLGLNRYSEDLEWKETARWVKFEEHYEETGKRWSKPFVPSLRLNALLEVRACIQNGVVWLESSADTKEELFSQLADAWKSENLISADEEKHVLKLLNLQYRHKYQKNPSKPDGTGKRMLRVFKTNRPGPVGDQNESKGDETPRSSRSASPEPYRHVSHDSDSEGQSKKEKKSPFAKKLHSDVEAAVVLVGGSSKLKRPIFAMVRMSSAVTLRGGLNEVSCPTRFVFIILGPEAFVDDYHEVAVRLVHYFPTKFFV